MSLLSKLSFMNPSAIKRNLEEAQRFAALPSDSIAFDVLKSLQKFPGNAFQSADRHQKVDGVNVEILKRLLTGIMGGEFPPSVATIEDAQFAKFKDLAEKGESIWKKSYPEDYSSYEKLIRYVIYIYRDTYSGGSVSDSIGWIWLSPEPHWTADEYAQNLIHEYTHNVLFLEEMVHSLFSVSAEVMALPENRVVSSIRRVPRYFDQSYHAAAVAIVLAEFAIYEGRFEDARTLIHGLLPSLDLMKEKRHLMSGHGFLLLEEMIYRGLDIFEQLSVLPTEILARETA